ncbi:MAG: hypothetical protein Q9167_003715 [Letrouitia subvulpina]
MSIIEDSIETAPIDDAQNIEHPLPKYIAGRDRLTQKLPFTDELRIHARFPFFNQLDRVTTGGKVQEQSYEDCSSDTSLTLPNKSQPIVENRIQPTTLKQLVQPKRNETDHTPLEFQGGVPKKAPPLQSSSWQTSKNIFHGQYLRQSPTFRNDNPSPQCEAQDFLDSLPLQPSRPPLPVPITSSTSFNDIYVLYFSPIGLSYEILLSALSRLFAHQVSSVRGDASRWELRFANIKSVKVTSRPTLFDERPEAVEVGPRNVCDAVQMVAGSRGELKLIVEIEDVSMEKGWIIEKSSHGWDDYKDYEVGSWWGNLKRARRESGQDRER